VIVVKVGGSLYSTAELAHCLSALANYATQHPIVIVPGGGPFADQVRTAQTIHLFNDEVAHHMAIIAMKQYGLLLQSHIPTCQTLNTLGSPKAPLSIWLPDDTLLSEPSLSKSWDISSDSIALWLANRLGAEQLLLIKRVFINTNSIKELTSQSIIDQGFKTLFSKRPITTKIIHHQAYDNLSDSIANPSLGLV